MKAKASQFHVDITPTSRARCRLCKRFIAKGDARLVTTSFVKHGFSTRFSRCLSCVDAKVATAIVVRYGDLSLLRSTPDVDPDTMERLRARIARQGSTVDARS